MSRRSWIIFCIVALLALISIRIWGNQMDAWGERVELCRHVMTYGSVAFFAVLLWTAGRKM